MAMPEVESGIYKIENLVNGKCYVGSAVNFKSRWSLHLSALRRNKHKNAKLQASWNVHGEECFRFVRVETVVDHAQLIQRRSG
jgi:group I intron endonuclease